MNIKCLLSFSASVLLCMYLGSCKESIQRSVDTTLLNGKWLVVNAKRNAKMTTILNEAYFVFGADSTLQTNFMGDDMSGSYSVKDDLISQEGVGDEGNSYKIISLSRDSLILSTEIQDYNFQFFLLNERLDPFDEIEDEVDLMNGRREQDEIES